MVKCKQCGKVMTASEFNNTMHKCVSEAMALPRAVLLKQLYESGGCSKAYYVEQLAKGE